MSPRSIYFRDQADACRKLAILLTDAETKEHLREMAVELIERALEIEGKGIGRDGKSYSKDHRRSKPLTGN
jgi:hypothetical protein